MIAFRISVIENDFGGVGRYWSTYVDFPWKPMCDNNIKSTLLIKLYVVFYYILFIMYLYIYIYINMLL